MHLLLSKSPGRQLPVVKMTYSCISQVTEQ